MEIIIFGVVIMFIVAVVLYFTRQKTLAIKEATEFWNLVRLGLHETLEIRSEGVVKCKSL